MKYYYSTYDEIVLTHSPMIETCADRVVRVRFERANKHGFDFAEAQLPDNRFTSSFGFSEDELFDLESYLKDNALLIWDYAQKGGGVNA